jgi:hypothetical protein
MMFDTHRNRVVLYGGRGASGALSDVHEWDGTTWTQRSTGGAAPLPHADHALVFDPASGHSVLFGGNDQASRPSSETWSYFVPCDAIGKGHATGSLMLACGTPPQIGTTLTLLFSNPSGTGSSGLMLAGGPCLPAPVTLTHPVLCTGSAFVWLAPVVVLPGADPAAFPLPVPALATLIGGTLCAQGFTAEAPGCARFTDGTAITLQP